MALFSRTLTSESRGVVKSLKGFPCRPVSLVHTQNFEFKSEKPTCHARSNFWN